MRNDMRNEWYNEANNTAAYERFDACNAEITSRCQKGAFLLLDNGERAFAYRYANLRPGTKVLCTVLKPAHGNLLTRVSVDSVVEYAAA